MKHFTFISNSPKSTLSFAKKLASLLQKQDILVLSGDLGAGKTKFTEGILSFFNLENEISSPTFTIVNEYDTPSTPIFHFDVYRLEDSSEFYEIGGEEYFQQGICLIEWGELVEDALPKDYLKICFSKDAFLENKRILSFYAYGDRYENLLNELSALDKRKDCDLF